jgi:hypothetical protein
MSLTRSAKGCEAASTTDALKDCVRSFVILGQGRERGERELRFGQFERFGFELESTMPADRGTAVPLRVFFRDQRKEVERVGKVDGSEFACGEFSMEEADRAGSRFGTGRLVSPATSYTTAAGATPHWLYVTAYSGLEA